MFNSDLTVYSILIAIIVIFISIVFYVINARKALRQGILLMGLCDSGKTLLYSRLVNGGYIQTQTSIKENIGTISRNGKKQKDPLQIIDLPGYERLRNQFLDQFKGQARGIIFVLDSVTIQKDLKDVAEYLYSLLTDDVIASNAPPFLIACNKHDQTLAKGTKVIQSLLQKEMSTLRVSKSAALEGTDSSGSTNIFLGKKDKDFEFSDLKSIKVEFAELSARGNKNGGEPEMQQLEEWLQRAV